MKENFNALDAFRGLAALAVCAYHVPQYWGFGLPRAPLAVDLFFILSGFVIGHSYESKLASGQLNAHSFMLIRLIRLYPLYLLSLLIAVTLVLLGLLVHHPLGSQHLAHEYAAAAIAGVLILPLHISSTDALFPLNVAYWSLLFELLNNLAYGLLHKKLSDRAVIVVVGIAAAALVAISHANEPNGIILGSFWGVTSLLGGLARSVFGFFAGLLLYRWRMRLPQLSARQPDSFGYLVPTAVIACVLVTPMLGKNEPIFELCVVFGVFPACVAAVVRSARTPGRSPVLRTLGLASYPIYVLHIPLAHMIDILTLKRLSDFAPIGGIAMTLVVLAVAVVSAYKVDIPVRRYLTAKLIHDAPSSQTLLKVS